MLHFNFILAFGFQPAGRYHFVVKLHVFLQSMLLIKPFEVLQNFRRILCHASVSEQDHLRTYLSHRIVGAPLWIWFKGVRINMRWSVLGRPLLSLLLLSREANRDSHIAGTSRILVFASIRTFLVIDRDNRSSSKELTFIPCSPDFRVFLVTNKLIVAELSLHFVRRAEPRCTAPT